MDREKTKKKALIIRYDKPAKNWQNESLPIGNGKIGAGIFGGIKEEIIQLNEESLWTGGPAVGREYNFGNDCTKIGNRYLMEKYFHDVREYFKKGNNKLAAETAEKILGTKDYFGNYQSLGQIIISFNLPNGKVSNYQRSLNVIDGIADVSYFVGDCMINREMFACNQSNVIVCRIETSKKIDFKIKYKADQNVVKKEFKDNNYIIHGSVTDNNMDYVSILNVKCNDGSILYNDREISVKGSKKVDLLFSVGTNYEHKFPTYRKSDKYNTYEVVLNTVNRARLLGYEQLFLEHKNDFSSKMQRVKLDIEQGDNFETTDKLLKKVKFGKRSKYLEVLLYQYGRYLLLSSSRENSILPANLQGIWNNSNTPPWQSDYHFNINLQMNYWPSCAANLKETIIPLIKYINGLVEAGRITAEIYTGQKRGFMIHTQNNPFGWTAPGWNFKWGWSPGAVSWILKNMYEYYEFSVDICTLKNDIYPLMKETVQMFSSLLVYNKEMDRYIFTPAYSPEHGRITDANTYEQSLACQLFMDTLKAAEILNENDKEFLEKTKKIYDKLRPLEIGESGQIKEWYDERKLQIKGRKHRHISHLVGLYPGNVFVTEEYMKAAEISLLARGYKNTGWAMAHRLNAWARLAKADKAYKLLLNIIRYSTLKNLWNSHPPFQIDGNFGYTAGVNEMLLQSHKGYIELIPAITSNWPNGHFEGLLARGALSVSCIWKDLSITQCNLLFLEDNSAVIDISKFVKRDKLKVVDVKNLIEIKYTVENNKLLFNGKKQCEYMIS